MKRVPKIATAIIVANIKGFSATHSKAEGTNIKNRIINPTVTAATNLRFLNAFTTFFLVITYLKILIFLFFIFFLLLNNYIDKSFLGIFPVFLY